MDKSNQTDINKTVKNLKEAAENINNSTKDYASSLEQANNAFKSAINNAPSSDKSIVANKVIQVNKLLNELKKGGNKEEIIKKINNLRIK